MNYLNFHFATLANCPKGSSETTREATFKNVYDPVFLNWFIGFTEGDGCFNVSENRCFFIIQQAEPDVLYKIKHKRKMGSITQPEDKVWRYTVTSKSDIFQRIHIFNGNRVLEKRRQQFQVWLENWNMHMHKSEKLPETFPVVPFSSRKPEFDLTNSWFSGFIDAEGCFNLVVQKNKAYSTGYRVRLRFIIDQTDALDLWPSYEKVMNSGFLKLRQPSQCHRYTITDRKVLSRIIDYLKKFPLKSRKHISFLRWYKCYSFLIQKKHLTPAGIQQILRWKKLSNKTLDS